MKPTLVILAAGLGSRYGGLKQLVPVGPDGSTIMDYTVYDALRAGFGRIVFVIRPDTEAAFRESVSHRFGRTIEVAYAHQRLDMLPAGFSVPPGRTKPWGTGHAVLAAAPLVSESFAVVNADDFYGADAFASLGAFLRDAEDDAPPVYAMVAYSLGATLTEGGSVSRGVCHCTEDGWLEKIVELTAVTKRGHGGEYSDESGQTRSLNADQPVSMNMWAFTRAFAGQLERAVVSFLRLHGTSNRLECYLPVVVGDLIQQGLARVKLLSGGNTWCGLTNPGDAERATEVIRALVRRGEYPPNLWS